MSLQVPLPDGWILSRDLMEKELAKLDPQDSFYKKDVSGFKYWLWIDRAPLIGNDSALYLNDLYIDMRE